jgi:hypothetical protein
MLEKKSFEEYSQSQLIKTLEEEVAKSSSELRTAQSRHRFLLSLIHYMKNKYGDKIK